MSLNGASTARRNHAVTRAAAVAPGSFSAGETPPGSGVSHTVTMPTSISDAINPYEKRQPPKLAA